MVLLGREPENKLDRERLIASEMNTIALGYLHVLAIAFGLFYFLRGLSYLLIFPADVAQLLGWPALASAGYSVLILTLIRYGALPTKIVEYAVLGIGILLMFNAFWNLYLTQNPAQFYNLGITLVACGLGTISFRLWIFQLVICLIGYFYSVAAMGLDWPAHIQLAVSSLFLSALAFFSRAPTIRGRVELQLQLQEKAAHLLAANKAKDRFLANMSHELRTPMTGVLGMMDLLRETPLNDDQKQLLQTAKTSASFLLAIINDVLDYSKLEAGKVVLRTEAFDADHTTSDVVEMLRPQASGKNISIDYVGPRALVPVLADKIRIGQVLYNLIGNAIKFTEKGKVTVTLEEDITTDGKVDLVWRVSDTGAGIPEARIPQLFERFEQVDQSETRVQQGTGLGLAIIRELVGLMGGAVSVKSQMGKGSTFEVRVALARVSAEALDIERAERPIGAWRTRPLRILVAEDNPVNQMLIGRLLEQEGWTVAMVSNGEAAVAAATKSDTPFDLVLMDVQMPVMDGVTAAGIIKEKMVNPPPVVALTANTMQDDVARYLGAGMDGHVAKPIVRDDMLDVIEAALTKHAERGADI